ncbi:MAG: DUF5011 domain-containing protein [Lachnospiraceae bacterium]|nr:DUF5011 domain-containing protein [Lachnospiraceae bacterium]
MKEEKKKLFIRCATFVIVCIGILGLAVLERQFHVEQVFKETTVELGTPISTEVDDYLVGKEWILERAVLDTTEMDETNPGQYKVYCKALYRKYTYLIRVEDTTAPTVEKWDDIPCLAVDAEYGVDTFISGVSDLSGEVNTYFLEYNGEQTTEVSFSEAGNYHICIRAEDASGNYTDTELTVMADVPPTLLGVWDRYIVKGTEYDVLGGVIAWDLEDGFLTEEIEAATDLDGDTEGAYEIVYTVQDHNGLSASKEAVIYVCEEGDVETYAQLDEQKLSEEELNFLCEQGFFCYEPLEEPDYDQSLELVRPTLINLRTENFGGSGFIVEIGPEYIYCISVEHVTRNLKEETNIVFYDDAIVNTTIDYVRLASSNEIVLFRIPTEIVPHDTLVNLKQISVDLDIYSKLKSGEPLIECCANWGFGFDDVIKKVTLKKITESVSFKGYDYTNTCIETTRGAKHGMSGTAMVDYRGNLVGVVSIINYSTGSDLNMKIDKLDTFRERILELEE